MYCIQLCLYSLVVGVLYYSSDNQVFLQRFYVHLFYIILLILPLYHISYSDFESILPVSEKVNGQTSEIYKGKEIPSLVPELEINEVHRDKGTGPSTLEPELGSIYEDVEPYTTKSPVGLPKVFIYLFKYFTFFKCTVKFGFYSIRNNSFSFKRQRGELDMQGEHV